MGHDCCRPPQLRCVGLQYLFFVYTQGYAADAAPPWAITLSPRVAGLRIPLASLANFRFIALLEINSTNTKHLFCYQIPIDNWMTNALAPALFFSIPTHVWQAYSSVLHRHPAGQNNTWKHSRLL